MHFYDNDAADRAIAKASTVVMYPQPMLIRSWSRNIEYAVDGCEISEKHPDGAYILYDEAIAIGQMHEKGENNIVFILAGRHPDMWVDDKDSLFAIQTPSGKWDWLGTIEDWRVIERFYTSEWECYWERKEAQKVA